MATLKIQNWGFYPNILEDSSSIQKYVNILMLMQWLKKEVKKFQRPASQPLYWWFLVKRGLSLIGVSRNSKYLQASTFLPCLSLSLLRKWWVGYTGQAHGSGTRVRYMKINLLEYPWINFNTFFCFDLILGKNNGKNQQYFFGTQPSTIYSLSFDDEFSRNVYRKASQRKTKGRVSCLFKSRK